MAFVANIGAPGSGNSSGAFAPPAVAGIYKVRFGETKMQPVKSAPEVTMVKIPVRAIATVDGAKASGYAEGLIFNIPPEHAGTYGEKYNLDAQQGRWRNLLEKAIAPEQVAALATRKKVEVDPAQWKDLEAYCRIDIKEDEYNGEKRMRGVISYWLTEEEAIAKVTGKKPTVGADASELTPEEAPLHPEEEESQLDLIPKTKPKG